MQPKARRLQWTMRCGARCIRSRAPRLAMSREYGMPAAGRHPRAHVLDSSAGWLRLATPLVTAATIARVPSRRRRAPDALPGCYRHHGTGHTLADRELETWVAPECRRVRVRHHAVPQARSRSRHAGRFALINATRLPPNARVDRGNARQRRSTRSIGKTGGVPEVQLAAIDGRDGRTRDRGDRGAVLPMGPVGGSRTARRSPGRAPTAANLWLLTRHRPTPSPTPRHRSRPRRRIASVRPVHCLTDVPHPDTMSTVESGSCAPPIYVELLVPNTIRPPSTYQPGWHRRRPAADSARSACRHGVHRDHLVVAVYLDGAADQVLRARVRAGPPRRPAAAGTPTDARDCPAHTRAPAAHRRRTGPSTAVEGDPGGSVHIVLDPDRAQPTGTAVTPKSLGLTGTGTFTITGVTALNDGPTPSTVHVAADGIEFDAVVRIDTPGEAEYYRHGGILQYVLRRMFAG
jgi:hypothetical protein